MSKKRAIVGAALAIFLVPAASIAQSADRPAIWSGAYIGVGAGGSWSENQSSAGGPTSTHSSYGSRAKALMGYNLQAGSAVYGVEAEVYRGFRTHQLSEAVYARAGLAQGNVLLFARLGVQSGQSSVTWFNTTTGATSTDKQTVFGPAVGIGAEWAVAPTLSLRTDLTTHWSDFKSTSPGGNQLEVKGVSTAVFGSVVYKFR